ncbi:hypothetical protein GTQ99_02600 [Kineococcus sp. T13]|uniref:hypothetical protein n=1 Tax=Kineococcus vitellinus TaxID=2696565 RepID=UPI001412693D|nr:hypothetical protein [Kineococcus vitellinus]NAZ74316.1 hypothetical protein [Kineococcus vitellinus]
MTLHRWPPTVPPDELGAVVHGPVILARATGIVAGLRCVFAHTTGLLLPFVLRAEGVQAEAASRQVFGHIHEPINDPHDTRSWSLPQVHVEVNDQAGFADSSGGPSSGGDDDFEMQARYWIDELPRDGRLSITVAWPQAGLSQTRTTLVLDDIDDLETKVLRLL